MRKLVTSKRQVDFLDDWCTLCRRPPNGTCCLFAYGIAIQSLGWKPCKPRHGNACSKASIWWRRHTGPTKQILLTKLRRLFRTAAAVSRVSPFWNGQIGRDWNGYWNVWQRARTRRSGGGREYILLAACCILALHGDVNRFVCKPLCIHCFLVQPFGNALLPCCPQDIQEELVSL